MLLVYTDEVLSEQRSQEAWKEVIAGHVSVKDEAAKKGSLALGQSLETGEHCHNDTTPRQ